MATAATTKGETAKLGAGRRAVVALLIALGALVFFVGSVTTWADRQALDTTSWTSASSRLLEDPTIRAALATYIVNELYANVDVSGELEQRLPDNLKGLAGPVGAALRVPAVSTADQLLGSQRVRALWRDANEVAHQRLVNVLENKTRAGISTEGGVVTLDLRVLVRDLGEQIGLPTAVLDKLPADTGQITVLKSDQLSAAQKVVTVIKALSLWLTFLVLAIWALAVYLAVGARRRTVRNIGWSVIFVGLLLLVVRRVVGTYAVDAVTTPSSEPAAWHVWLIFSGILGQIGWSAIAYGIVGTAGAILAGPTRAATATRRFVAPALNARALVVASAAVAFFLLLVAWAPTHAFRTLVGVGVLAALLALGLVALRRQTLAEFPEVAFAGFGGLGLKVRQLSGRGSEPASAAPAPTAGNGGVDVDQLERLRELHRSGGLTDEEFAEAKRRVLAGS